MEFFILLIIFSIIIFIGALFWGIKYAVKVEEEQNKATQEFANTHGYEFNDVLEDEISFFGLLKWGGSKRSVKNPIKKDDLLIFDYLYNTGKTQIKYTIIQYKFKVDVPSFTIVKRNFFHNIGRLFGYKSVQLRHKSNFDKLYFLRGKDENKIKDFFTIDKTNFFEHLGEFNQIEVRDNVFMTYKYKVKLEKYDEFIENTKRIIDVLEK